VIEEPWGIAEDEIPEELKIAKHKKILEEEKQNEMINLAATKRHYKPSHHKKHKHRHHKHEKPSFNNRWNFEPQPHRLAPVFAKKHFKPMWEDE
jgi:hypothetical protein